jgi:curved DNA-binding protein
LEQAYAGGPQRLTINERTYDVRIPPGIGTGQTIRLAGQAPGGGDVLLEVAIAGHQRFALEGRNVVGRVSVTPWQAALGAPVQVETLGGALNLSIPPGSQSGRRLRLKGRGMPGPTPGDHYVVVDVRVPEPRTEAQREAYAQLARAFDDDAGADS